MSAPQREPEAAGVPPAVEEQANEILLGPPDLVEPRFAALCAAHEPWREDLQRLRRDFERAARALLEHDDPVPATMPAAIGPYRCVRPIGQGAFGVVYLAEQQQPIRREVAIKLLHALRGPNTIARFLNERETLARMNHPAIARIFDAGVDGEGRPYFVMEYVHGESLHRFVATRAAGLRARIELFLLACEGVNHAHQRGVIHRDLKPLNILVAEVDGRWLPKVIDFGLAKILEADRVDPVQTRAGAVLGTPAYMSPEQLRGDAHEADTRTDVYALGVILYELLTSTLPVALDRQRECTLVELQRLLLATEPLLASVQAGAAGMPFARHLRGDLDWILRKAMAHHEADRYASVAEFAADLRRHFAHEPVTAGPPTVGYVVRKFVRRHRSAVTAGSVVFLSLVLGLVVSALSWRRADANAQLAQRRLADFWRLADVVALEELISAEKTLWPSSPGKLAAHEQWLARAQALVARRAVHAATVVDLQQQRPGGSPGPGDGEAALGAGFLLTSLQRHLVALDAFAGEGGLLSSVARRSQFARTVQARSIDDVLPAWQRAIDAVAASPRYGGLRLAPMLGLVPLGADLDSGLEEFAHLQSGTVPKRDASGQLLIDDGSAIVLVLVPGGDHQVGSQSEHPGQPDHDPFRQPDETPPTTARLAPYLLGKYELTQGQVQAMGMRVHATGRRGGTVGGAEAFTPRHPEETVSVPELVAWLPQFGLRLPDGFEWEVAARAGSPAIWGVGSAARDLQGFANVADATLADAAPYGVVTDRAVRDGFLGHAPVGSLQANGFGFHDLLGNVAELTTAHDAAGEAYYFARGGSFRDPPVDCRITAHWQVMPNLTSSGLGVRVAASLPSR